MAFSSAIPFDADDYGSEGEDGDDGADDGLDDGEGEDDYGPEGSDLDEDGMSDGASSKSGGLMYSDEEGVSVDMGEENEKSNDPAAVEERRKGKRMEKLEKRIKAL